MQLQFDIRYGKIVPNYARKKYFHGDGVIGDATGRPQKCLSIFVCKWEINAFRDNTMEHNTAEYNTMEHNTTQQSTTQQHNATEHNTTEQSTLPVCLLWWICQSWDSRFALVWTCSLCTSRKPLGNDGMHIRVKCRRFVCDFSSNMTVGPVSSSSEDILKSRELRFACIHKEPWVNCSQTCVNIVDHVSSGWRDLNLGPMVLAGC